MISVSASKFQKQFGEYKDKAQREPIMITSYNRNSMVLISADEYQRYKDMEDNEQIAMHPADMNAEEIAALEAAMHSTDGEEFNHECE